MNLRKDYSRGILTLERLNSAFRDKNFFKIKALPYSLLPEGMEAGTKEHQNFVTYISSIDYLRQEEDLWQCARDTYEDPQTRYLFEPKEVLIKPSRELLNDLQSHRLFLTNQQLRRWNFRKYELQTKKKIEGKDIEYWINISKMLKEFDNDLSNLFAQFDNNALEIIKEFSTGKYLPCFPKYAKERKVIVWLKRMKEFSDIEFNNFDKLKLPVDHHTIRATFYSGSISGKVSSFDLNLPKIISDYWKEVSTKEGYTLNKEPIEFEGLLWLLSKYGCSLRSNPKKCQLFTRCPIGDFCSKGKVKILDDFVSIDIEQA